MCATDGHILERSARVLSNLREGDRLFVMALECPDIASKVKPGQFVHMKIPNFDSHILRRPFSVYACDKARGTLEILYQVVGEGTDEMTRIASGADVSLIGPIGRGWSAPAKTKHALLIGGGVGAAPLYMLCEKLRDAGVDVEVILGAASKSCLVTHDRYEGLCGCAPKCSTDDGSFGREGFCTILAEEAIAEAQGAGVPFDYVAVCGPEPLMRIVSKMTSDAGVACQVSMEKRMACGIGACLSCVVNTREGKRRACIDGPIFDAEDILW